MRISLAFAALAALALLLINEASWRESTSSVQRILQAQQMRLGAGRLMRAVLDAETGQRGFLLTGESSYLEPYRQAQAEIDSALAQLQGVLADYPAERREFDELRHYLRLKLDELDLTVRLRQQGRGEAWRFVLGSDVGAQHMAHIRQQSDKLIAAGNIHIETSFRQIRQSLVLSRIGVAAMVAIALLAFALYLRQSQALMLHTQDRQRRLEEERDLLEGQVRARTASLRELATHLQKVREDERGFLARELHDELGALLTAAKLDVARIKSRLGPQAPDALERLDHLTATLNQGIALKRRIVEDLRPSSLTHLGLAASLEILAGEFAERSELQVHTELEPLQLSEDLQITIYRLVQESLTNIGKYAHARQAWLRLRRTGEAVNVEVEDNGEGFDTESVSPGRHGLAGMRHRVEALGGRLEIRSGAGQGTRIQASLPAGAPPRT